MPSLDVMTAAPRLIHVAGQSYAVRPLTLRQWGDLQAWLRDNGLSPLRQIRANDLEHLTPEQQQVILDAAYRDQKATWPPAVGSLDWVHAMSAAPGGNTEFIRAVLSRDRPDVTTEVAELIREQATELENQAILFAALGFEVPDPKSAAPETLPMTATEPPGPTSGGGASTP